jgi:hypothetical protein
MKVGIYETGQNQTSQTNCGIDYKLRHVMEIHTLKTETKFPST